MNAFRVAILSLLVVVVGVMCYAVFVLLPGMQADHDIYEISQKNAQAAAQDAGHREKVSEYATDTRSDELATAYTEAENAERDAEKLVYEAEEKAVIEEAKRKAEAALAQQTKQESQEAKAIGLVTSFNKDWVSIMFKPAVQEPLNEGLVIAVRREGVILCEATVDFRDEESGQLGATLKPQEFGKAQVNIDEEKMLPIPGDEVIYSPFATAHDLRAEYSFLKPTPLSVPARVTEPAAQ